MHWTVVGLSYRVKPMWPLTMKSYETYSALQNSTNQNRSYVNTYYNNIVLYYSTGMTGTNLVGVKHDVTKRCKRDCMSSTQDSLSSSDS